MHHQELFYSALLGDLAQDIQELACQVDMGLMGLHVSIAAIAGVEQTLGALKSMLGSWKLILA